MEKLKNYIVPLVGLVVLGVWFFVLQPSLEGDRADAPAEPAAPEATPAPSGRPAVVPLDPLVEGELGAPLVREVVEAGLDQLLACYEEGIARTPDARGRILLRIVVRPEGTVRSADVAGSQVKDDGIGRCFAKKAAIWEFPSSERGGSTQVTYPFQLQIEPIG